MPFKDPAVAKAYRDSYRKKNRKKLRAAARKRHFDNRDEHLAYLKQYRKNHLDERRDYELRRLYGITLVEYNAILLSQDGDCGICRNPPGKRLLSVDHDHTTKRSAVSFAIIATVDSVI